MCMQEDDAESDKKGLRPLHAYTLANETGRNDEKRPITAQVFIDVQGNDSYCHHTSYTVGPLRSKFNYDKNRFLKRLAPIVGAAENVFTRSIRTPLSISVALPDPGGTPR